MSERERANALGVARARTHTQAQTHRHTHKHTHTHTRARNGTDFQRKLWTKVFDLRARFSECSLSKLNTSLRAR